MDEKAFLRAYKSLNKDQKKAVDTIEGPVMVIAGPGTGKTNILTLRIANILRSTDTAPENILALTFTESGVYSMRKKLVEIIGSTAYRVTITTFHGFCNDIIKKYPDEFKDIAGGEHLDPVEQIKILEEIITHMRFSILRATANPHFYLYPTLKKIGELKKDAVTPRLFKEYLKKEKEKLLSTKDHYHTKGEKRGQLKGEHRKALRGIQRSEEFLKIYKKYEETLKEKHLYDYDDMIIEVVKTLKENKNFLLELEEEYQYILADEHQDANMGQNTLLELLSSFHSPYPNLFIVGDEKQAIFRFQGASLENFNYFKKLYPLARKITLKENYRSTQTILDAAGSLIKKSVSDGEDSRVGLVSSRKQKGAPVAVHAFSSLEDEGIFVAEQVKALLDKKVPSGEIAILYRDNKDATIFTELFLREGIPHIVLSDTNILEDNEISNFLELLYTINNFGEDAYLVPLLGSYLWGIDPLDIYKVLAYGGKNKEKLYDIIKKPSLLIKAEVENSVSFTLLYEKLSKWKKLSENEPFSVFFETVAHESGFVKMLLIHREANKKLEALERLYKEVEREAKKYPHYKLSDFLCHIELVARYKLALSSRDRVLYQNAVQLMTAHRAKGLEFLYVFVVGVTDKHWGNRKTRVLFPVSLFSKGDNTIDDERRLFYVALTRAKKEVMVTYAKEGVEGRQTLPSQFIEEIDEQFKKEDTVTSVSLKKGKGLTQLLLPRKGEKELLKEKEYLNALFIDYGLSVTALNNYLLCPWRYFYVNLLRVPELSVPPQMYGTAMHKALQHCFLSLKKGEAINAKKLIGFFNDSLEKFPLTEKVFKEYKKRGERALSGYYAHHKNTWACNGKEEFPIYGVFLEKDIKLRGKLDRIIFKEGNKVSVIDYKTGKPRSRNDILGKTKKSVGDYFRQLVFYKLLLSLYDNGKFTMDEGIIDFLEPNDSGKYRQEIFFVSDDDVEALKGTIKKTAGEIQNLLFWERRCGDRTCKFCKMRFKE